MQCSLQCSNEWNVFKNRDLHIIHLNIKSLLPKIEELRVIAKSINSKPIIVGTIHRPASQNNFLEFLNSNMSKINSVDNEIYILGDFNINLFLNDSYVLEKNNILNSKSIPNDVKSYHEFCTFFGLKQLIKVPTRTTTSSSTIIDHILASYPERVTQCGVIDISLSDHQLIYCTRKISRIKRGSHKQILFRSFKHYTIFLSKNYQN